MRALKSPGRLVGGHDVNRYHKLFPHRLFPDHRWSIYQDGNLSFAGDHASLVARVSDGGAALGAFWHPDGHDMRREVEACKRMKFDRRDLDVIEAQLAAYAQEGIGPDTRIPTNYLLVRDHAHPALPMAMDIWWAQLFQFTKRDQISLLYSLKKADAKWVPLDGDDPGAIDPALVSTRWHRPPLVQRIRRRLHKSFGIVPRS